MTGFWAHRRANHVRHGVHLSMRIIVAERITSGFTVAMISARLVAIDLL